MKSCKSIKKRENNKFGSACLNFNIEHDQFKKEMENEVGYEFMLNIHKIKIGK